MNHWRRDNRDWVDPIVDWVLRIPNWLLTALFISLILVALSVAQCLTNLGAV